jgi:hypothetical protein
VSTDRTLTDLAIAQARSAAQGMRRFTIPELHSAIGVGTHTARLLVNAMVERGMVVKTDELERTGLRGRPAHVYEFVRPKPKPVNRPRRTPPELEARGAVTQLSTKLLPGSAPRPGSKKPRVKSNDKATDELIALAYKTPGWKVLRDGQGHVRFVAPDGTVTQGALTPSDVRSVPNLRANLKRMGLLE